MTAAPLLDVRDLTVEFATRRGVVSAVRNINLSVGNGETVAIVGESGSGKSVTAYAVLRILDRAGRIAGGSIGFSGISIEAQSCWRCRAHRCAGRVAASVPLLRRADADHRDLRGRLPAATARVVIELDDEAGHVMSAPIDLDHHIIDHLCRWSRTGRDGACLKRSRMRGDADRQRPSGSELADVIGLWVAIVSIGLTDPCQHRRRSEIAAPITTTKSP